jgi:hypothetical protein
MGVLPQTGNNPDEGVGSGFGAIAEPIDRTGFFENVSAGYRAAQAGPGTTRSRQNAHEAELYNQVIAALSAEGELGADRLAVRPGGIGYRGPKDIPVNAYGVGFVDQRRPFRNPYTAKPSLSQSDNPLARLYLGGDLEEKDAIWAAVQRVRQRKPEFLKDLADEKSLAARAIASRTKELQSAEAVLSRAGTAGTIGGFVGGVAGSIVAGDPENAVGVGIGGAASRTVSRTIIKRATQEGAINVGAGVVALPGIAADADRLDIEITAGDMVRSVVEQGAVGVVLGATAAGARPAAGKIKEVSGKLVEGAVDRLADTSPAARDAIVAASIRAGTVRDRELLSEYRRLHSPYSVSDTSTPDERAAINIVEREIEVREASPLAPDADPDHENRLETIAASLGVDLPPPPVPTPAPVQVPTVRDRSDAPVPRRQASYVEAVHQAEGTGKNPKSSAFGHFQFTKGTWLEYAPRVADTTGMSERQILNLRKDRRIAEKAEQMFRADNGRYLVQRGVEDSPGNLSLAHFLGKVDAAKVARAEADTPIRSLVDPDSYAANPEVFGKNDTAGKMVSWAHRRIGATVDTPPARPDAVPETDYSDEMDYAAVRPYATATFRPDEIETDAGLMQYKSGGDETGVTDKLRDVTAWNPMLSSEILVWEGLDGRKVVVDGHQRAGLAKRLDDPTIQLPAIVIREADGITPDQARVLGALRNINLGTGSLLDNARVLRDAPNGSAMLKGAEKRREIEGLSRLSHEAFGAALNDIIDPEIASHIGRVAGDAPDTHMALVDLLLKNRIRDPREAANIIRQAHADGYGRPEAEQMSMFGDMPTESLYVPIARILSAASKRLREDKRTFSTLASRAGKIEEAGNVLDRAANQGRVGSAAEAIGIVEATAHRSGPVRDALIAAARAELSGARRGDAVNQFLAELEGIDLRAAAAGVGRDGRPGEPSGEAGSGDAVPEAIDELPDRLEPSLFDQAVDSAQRGEAFSDPVGEGAKGQIALLEHDLQMDEAALRTASPLRPGDIDPEGTMGLSLFDAADQPTFRLSEEGDARSLADLIADNEADEIAAANARACLNPPKVTE